MAWFNKKVLQSNSSTTKSFSYKKGDCNLSFSLRTDKKSEVGDFLEILEAAIKEVKQELDK